MIKYPLAKETITNLEIDRLIDWLKTYPRLTMGNVTKEFEKQWAKYIGTKYSVFVNSGSSANLLMIYALLQSGKIKCGDKIIVPAVGWGTTISPIIQLGLIPIMVDVDPYTFSIDINLVEKKLSEDKNIRAIMYVQSLGVPANNSELIKLANKYSVFLLEDACASLGSMSENKMVGSFGDMSTFSFYFGHQLSTIEGGMINTNNFELYEILLMARSHGWGKDLSKSTYDKLMGESNIDKFHEPFTFFIPGFNLRPTDLQSYIGIGQLEKAEWCANRRNENHMRYIENLSEKINFQIPQPEDRISSISFGGIVKDVCDRIKIIDELVKHGIETRIFSAGNLGKHPFWKKYNGKMSSFPVADLIHSNGFFLPNYPELTLEDVDYISLVVNNAI